MKLHTTYLEGAVLPTVVVAALVMLTATLGLLALWEQETLLFTRTQRLRQARADVESAALLYRLHPDERALTAAGGYLLYDSLPQSRIFVRREPWGLYELLHITTADSLVASSRIVGAEPDPARTLFYADDRTAVTLAGDTRLHGTLRLPQNGLTYGRVGAEFYRGEEVPRTAIRSSAAMLPAPSAAVAARIGALFAFAQQLPAAGDLPDSLGISFRDPTVALRLGTAEIGGCTLRGRIVLAADELRIDSACRLENVLVCARKITVGSGARIAAQLFARDTVVVEPCAVLEYPSGIYAGRYAELGDRATADGYVIVRDTVRHKKMAASYRQSRTARVRGLLHADGAAQVRGSSRGVRSSDRPSTSRRRDTTRICSTTLRCSKIPPRRNRCGTAAPRPCAERRPYASSKTGLGRKAARGLARRSRRSGGGAADRFHGGNGAAAPSDAARGRCARSCRSRIPGHVRLRQIRIRRMARRHVRRAVRRRRSDGARGAVSAIQ